MSNTNGTGQNGDGPRTTRLSLVQDTDQPTWSGTDDDQERAAWGILSEACIVALEQMHPEHPERFTFTEMLGECRHAALAGTYRSEGVR